MIGKRLKIEIAQFQLGDLERGNHASCKPSVSWDHITKR